MMLLIFANNDMVVESFTLAMVFIVLGFVMTWFMYSKAGSDAPGKY